MHLHYRMLLLFSLLFVRLSPALASCSEAKSRKHSFRCAVFWWPYRCNACVYMDHTHICAKRVVDGHCIASLHNACFCRYWCETLSLALLTNQTQKIAPSLYNDLVAGRQGGGPDVLRWVYTRAISFTPRERTRYGTCSRRRITRIYLCLRVAIPFAIAKPTFLFDLGLTSLSTTLIITLLFSVAFLKHPTAALLTRKHTMCWIDGTLRNEYSNWSRTSF